MNKPSIVAISLLAALVGYLGHRAYVTRNDPYDGNKGLYAPNALHKIQPPFPIPVQGITPEDSKKYFEAAMKAWVDEHAEKTDHTLLIRNVPIERLDQRTIEQKQMRKLYNVHDW